LTLQTSWEDFMHSGQGQRRLNFRIVFFLVFTFLIGVEIQTRPLRAADASGDFLGIQTLDDGGDSDGEGGAVAIDGDTAVVGCVVDTIGNKVAQGSAIVYVRDHGRWQKQQRLYANDGASKDYFGGAVAISGDTIVVSAPRYGPVEDRQGAAYVFVRNGGIWVQQAKLTAEGDPPQYVFGFSVSISGNQIAVGAPNALQGPAGAQSPNGGVYIFTRSGSIWTRSLKLGAADGARLEAFGGSVSLSGNRLAVSAPAANIENQAFRGAVYIYEGAASTWEQRAKLTAGEGGPTDSFGVSLALDGDTLLVGSPSDSAGNHFNQGATYVYVASSTTPRTWSLQKRIVLADGVGGDRFGISVALSGDVAVTGANNSQLEEAPERNAAYVFLRTGTDWTRKQKLESGEKADNESYGGAIAIEGDVIFAGDSYAGKVLVFLETRQPLVVNVSAASYSASSLASESIVAAFGSGLATDVVVGSTFPLPTSLAGTTVVVRDSVGNSRPAPLFFVSPQQINYQLPPGTAMGPATALISAGDGKFSGGGLMVSTIGPSLFTADSSGKGLASAIALRVQPGGGQSFEPVARFDPALNQIVATPIDLGGAGEQVFLVLYCTGARYRSSLAGVTVLVGGEAGNVAFAGEAPGFVGLDQINVLLSRSLIGRGEVEVLLTVDNVNANPVRVHIR
jgi:uncharacterized protein (TIGR03437 family)